MICIPSQTEAIKSDNKWKNELLRPSAFWLPTCCSDAGVFTTTVFLKHSTDILSVMLIEPLIDLTVIAACLIRIHGYSSTGCYHWTSCHRNYGPLLSLNCCRVRSHRCLPWQVSADGSIGTAARTNFDVYQILPSQAEIME